MNKNYLTLFFAALLPLGTYAQQFGDDSDFAFGGDEIEGRHWTMSLGAKAGVTMSNMDDYDLVDLGAGFGTGYTAGAVLDARFGRRNEAGSYGKTSWWGLQLEVLYSARNIKTDYDDLKLNYLEVPVLFQFYPTSNFYIEAGATFAKLLSSKPKEMQAENIIIPTGELSGGDFLPTVGLGLKLKKGFTADVRYNIGTSELAGDFPCKTSMIAVSVGWMFDVVK
ncbi:MAG: PorT family protein [Bacteroidales bacterium]|nr:PorT family protein [Bacteroidales bacterium]